MANNDTTSDGNQFYQGFVQRGFTPVQAAVLAGNVQQESGFDPTAYNPKEDAAGALQWRQDRLSGLVNYANATNRVPSDPDLQMDWIVKEMQGPEARNAAPFLAANDPQTANAALKQFVRYGDNSQNARLQNAMAFMAPAARTPAVQAIDAATSGAPAGGPPINPPAVGDRVQQLAAATNGSPAGVTSPDTSATVAPTATGQNGATSRAQFLQQWGADPASAGTSSAASSTPGSSATPSPERAAFLKSWGVSAGSPADSNSPVPNSATASPTSIATGPGTFAGQPVTPGAMGNNPMARGKPSTAPSPPSGPAAAPSSVPWLDPISAFANAAVDAIPVVGPGLTKIGNSVDAGINNLLGYPSETAADRASINAANAAKNPMMAGAGSVAGSVAPFLFVGPEGVAAKAMGMAGDMGGGSVGGNLLLRAAAGAGSGAAMTGVDTAARGGSPSDVFHNALTGGAIGAVAAPATHFIGDVASKAWQALRGPSASEAVAKALAQDQLAPSNVNMLTSKMGPGATVADLGPNTRNLASAVAGTPGQGQSIVRQNIDARAANAGNRLTGDVAANLGKGQPIGQATQAIIDGQQAAAKPLYTAIEPVPVQMTPTLQHIASTPLGQQVFNRAAETMANQGKSGAGMTVGFLDAAKQALDDVVSSNRRAGNSNFARIAGDMAGDLTAEVDRQVPKYAAARDAFAGPAKVLDAIEMGQGAFAKSMSPEQLQTALAGMSQSEKDGLLQGAQSAAQQMIGNARSDAAGARAAFQSSNAKAKLAILIGPQQAQAIGDALDREAGFAATDAAVGRGTEQSAAQSAKAAVTPAAPSDIGKLTAVGIIPAAFAGARKALTNVYRSGQNVKLANMLTGSLSPEDAQAIAAAGRPDGGGIPGAAIPLASKNSSTPSNNMLQWAYPNMLTRQSPDPTLPPGAGGPNGPLRIVVPGANRAAAQ